MQGLILYYLIINSMAFLFMGLDKQHARHGKWRYRESSLLGCPVCGGAFGAWVGMYLFHHKTKKRKFTFLLPCFILFHCFLFFVLSKAVS